MSKPRFTDRLVHRAVTPAPAPVASATDSDVVGFAEIPTRQGVSRVPVEIPEGTGRMSANTGRSNLPKSGCVAETHVPIAEPTSADLESTIRNATFRGYRVDAKAAKRVLDDKRRSDLVRGAARPSRTAARQAAVASCRASVKARGGDRIVWRRSFESIKARAPDAPPHKPSEVDAASDNAVDGRESDASSKASRSVQWSR